MKKLMAIAAMVAAFGLGGAAAYAASTDKPANPGGGNDGQVCPAGDSGKIDVGGGTSVTVTAPDGKLISGYCVKAGSANQGLGPEFVTVDPPQKTVTITHSSGKDVSHYSVTYVDDTVTTTTETETTTTETETTTTETTETETTSTETTSTETTSTETTPAETTSTETTSAETTTEDPADEVEEQQVFTPPAQQVKSAQTSQGGPAAAAAPAAATKPSTAAQPAPYTP